MREIKFRSWDKQAKEYIDRDSNVIERQRQWNDIGVVEFYGDQWVVGDNSLIDVTEHDVISNIHEQPELLEETK